MHGEELAYIHQTFDTNQVSLGPHMDAFQQESASMLVPVTFAASVNPVCYEKLCRCFLLPSRIPGIWSR